jgi:hypothetical protein
VAETVGDDKEAEANVSVEALMTDADVVPEV